MKHLEPYADTKFVKCSMVAMDDEVGEELRERVTKSTRIAFAVRQWFKLCRGCKLSKKWTECK